jgi:hypothetical protein
MHPAIAPSRRYLKPAVVVCAMPAPDACSSLLSRVLLVAGCLPIRGVLLGPILESQICSWCESAGPGTDGCRILPA